MAEKENKKKKQTYVSLVEDPFQMPNLEISDAQNNSEPLDLDKELELEHDPIDMEKLSKAVEQASEEAVEEMKAQMPETAEEAAEELAQQIAEDEQLAREIAEQEKLDAEAEEEGNAELKAALPQPDENGNLDVAEVESCLEALLFMSDKPMSLDKLRDLIGPDYPLSVFQEAVTQLVDRYKQVRYGIEVVQVAGGFQFRTKPGRAALARKLAKVQTQKLSTGAMETLAIVAYKQPVMKEEIDTIRGVDSSYFIRGLMDRHLIEIGGRSELPGRPMLYKTSKEFLEIFGLKDLSVMPSLRELEQMIPASQSDKAEEEDPRVREMRRLVGEMKADHSSALKYDPREDEVILKEIRERVSSIPTSTPYLDEQKAAEKAAAEAAANPPSMEVALEAMADAAGQIPLEAAQLPEIILSSSPTAEEAVPSEQPV